MIKYKLLWWWWLLLLSFILCWLALSENKSYENLESQQSSVRHAISYYQFTPHFEPPGSMYDWNESSVGLQLIEFFAFMVSAVRLWCFYLCFVTRNASLCIYRHGLTLCQMCLWGHCVLLSLRYFTQIYHSAMEKVQQHNKFFCVFKNVIMHYVGKHDAKRMFLIFLSNCIAITVGLLQK